MCIVIHWSGALGCLGVSRSLTGAMIPDSMVSRYRRYQWTGGAVRALTSGVLVVEPSSVFG